MSPPPGHKSETVLPRLKKLRPNQHPGAVECLRLSSITIHASSNPRLNPCQKLRRNNRSHPAITHRQRQLRKTTGCVSQQILITTSRIRTSPRRSCSATSASAASSGGKNSALHVLRCN